MLEASIAAFGDVVRALLIDLDHASVGLTSMAWLSSTRSMVENEQTYAAAMHQLQWWDSFLATLPNPPLLSEQKTRDLQRIRALRTRTTIQAREQALQEHRRLVDQELAEAGRSQERWSLLRGVRDDPGPGQWRVDPDDFVRNALAALPSETRIVPIVAADLDPQHSFGGFNAVGAMRNHPELAARAAHMDAAIAEALQRELNLPKADAARHAAALTGMFWIALRRALSAGSHQLATSIRMLSQAQPAPLQTRFTEELLESWMVYLDAIPAVPKRPSLMSRVPLLGGLFGKKAIEEKGGEAPKQLTDGAGKKKKKGWFGS